MQHIKTQLLVALLLSVFGRLYATNPPPVNDTVCDAINLGLLPVPGPCPSYPYGDTVHVNGTTDFASYNTFDFSPVSCFPSGAPDVWYKFRSTGNYIYIELYGYGNLDSMFVKLYQSQGSCLGLIPGHCETTFNGVIQASILTADIGGEYYLQIGGSQYNETGNFMFSIKSFNDCNDCVKNAHVTLDPAPWFGRYGTSDTVNMCYTVDRWDQTTTSKLHAVVPEFGDEWDTTTLVPVSFPATATGWIWGNDINSSLGTHDGFYFDGNFNGDPTDNPGQGGNVTTSWEFCWSIATKPFCNAYDAHVEVHVTSDNQTGNGNSLALCNEPVSMWMSMSGWCCPDPIVTVTTTGGCANVATILVDPVSVNAGDTFNIVLYDDSMHVYAYSPTIITTTLFTAPSGDYLLEVYNVSTGCISFHQVHIPGAFEIDIVQTNVGCGAGTGEAIAYPVGGTAPFIYNWLIASAWTDSIAYNLDEGYANVRITDAMGCTVDDSIYITVLPTAGAYFEYPDKSRCHDEDTIQTSMPPYTMGGTWMLVSPTGSPITVDAVGTIHLNNCTLPTPYWVVVKYTAGTICTDTYVDSVQIVQKPSVPTPAVSLLQDWCIGSSTPTLSVGFQNGLPTWYGLQTAQSGIGFTFQPNLGATTAPGLYMYSVATTADITYGCISSIITFTVNAIASPSFTMSSDVTICPGDTASISATGSGTYSYYWNPAPTLGAQNLPSSSTSPAGTTTYTVDVTDALCTAQGFVTVTVDSSVTCGQQQLYNGITPNGDGHNDFWYIDAADNSNDLLVCVYNRWGEMVWKGVNYDNNIVVFRGRNGKDEPLPSGTYFYTIQQENREPAKGWLEITR